MMNTLWRTTAGAALTLALLGPVAAQAATSTSRPPVNYVMQTRLFDRYSVGEYDGQLSITVYPDGIIQGTYHDDNGALRPVTGGVNGKDVWLDIGWRRPLHLTGTLQNGVLRAIAALPGPELYELDSTSVKQTG